MRRCFFVQSFYGRMDGLEQVGPLRKTGLYGYDSVAALPAGRADHGAEHGLGIVEEFKYLARQTDRPLKATCPGR